MVRAKARRREGVLLYQRPFVETLVANRLASHVSGQSSGMFPGSQLDRSFPKTEYAILPLKGRWPPQGVGGVFPFRISPHSWSLLHIATPPVAQKRATSPQKGRAFAQAFHIQFASGAANTDSGALHQRPFGSRSDGEISRIFSATPASQTSATSPKITDSASVPQR